MVEELVDTMIDIVQKLQGSILADIEDVKKANHEKLLSRNDEKQENMQKIVELKQKLNQELVSEMKNGVDVNIYRSKVDKLEEELKKLYTLNGRLAAIVLPVRQMYREIVEDLTEMSGGSLIDVRA